MKKRRVISALCGFALLLTACGGESTTTEENKFVQRNKNAVFKEETGIFDLEEGDVTQIQMGGDTIYIEQYVYDYGEIDTVNSDGAEEIIEEAVAEEGSMEDMARAAVSVVAEPAEEAYVSPMVTRYITSYQPDGTLIKRISMKVDENSGSGSMAFDENGNIYSIFYQYATYEGEDTTDKVYLQSYTSEGEETMKVWLNENETEDYFYVSSLYVTKEGQLLLDTSRGIEIYDTAGNPVKMIEKEETQDARLLRIREEQYALVTSTGESAAIQTLDIQSGTFGEKQNLPFNYYMYGLYDGKYYDVYLNDEYGIYGYNMGDTEITKIMDYISSDFTVNNLSYFVFVEEETFIASYYGEDGRVLSRFTKVAPEEVAEKIDLTLGCYYLSYDIKEKLIEFNKNSDKYRINLVDYSSYNTMDDYTVGLNRMNTDIVSGDVPDILIMGNEMPVNSYIAKGIFMDLNTFLEKDNEVKKEDLMPNVLQALSSEDGLYRIAPYFGVSTFAAKTSDVGEKQGWNMEMAQEILATKPEGTNLFSEMTSSSFVYNAMAICGERYVDWEKGECYFDGEEFKNVLEYAESLPREIDYSDMDENYWNEWEAQFRNGATLVYGVYISAFRDYAYAKQAVFGEDITLIGFPVEEDMGAGISVGNTMSISALSKNQEGAWEFVKSFLTEEYQDSLEYGLPLRISSLDKMAEKATQKPYYLDEDGNKVEYEDTFYVNGMDITAVPLTKEETTVVMDYIRSLDKLCAYNEAINEIIFEEAESYFSGQKSVEDVTSVIQSRVKIYINENS